MKENKTWRRKKVVFANNAQRLRGSRRKIENIETEKLSNLEEAIKDFRPPSADDFDY